MTRRRGKLLTLKTWLTAKELSSPHAVWHPQDKPVMGDKGGWLKTKVCQGTGTTHSTHGIVLQEPSSDSNESIVIQEPSSDSNESIVIQEPSSDSNESESIPQARNNSGISSDISNPISQKKKRSATYRPQQLQPCFVKPRAEPIIQIDKKDALAAVTESAALKSDFLWFFLRANFPSKFPHWKGWLYLTSNQTPEHKSTIEYMPPINATINENSTIQKIIQFSQNATNDLAVAKKAYNILWRRSDLYQNVFIHLGAFHTALSYLSALGKLMKGSGFDDIVVGAVMNDVSLPSAISCPPRSDPSPAIIVPTAGPSGKTQKAARRKTEDQLLTIVQDLLKAPEEDENDAFAKTVAFKMRKLNLRQRL
ncbi:hypothetical protein ElyMa_000367300 [Elysia marginata]|uniref:Uncharacterized protein n=1 Tax=Elysia marginata TaxID=1093978 RepID=A0AAV4FGY5_9GAST|nr:hypothetical protein ElyMa_000367300 [Elysia marginata]